MSAPLTTAVYFGRIAGMSDPDPAAIVQRCLENICAGMGISPEAMRRPPSGPVPPDVQKAIDELNETICAAQARLADGAWKFRIK